MLRVTGKRSHFSCSEILNADSRGLRQMPAGPDGSHSKENAATNQDKLDCAFDLHVASELLLIVVSSPAALCMFVWENKCRSGII